MFDFSQVIGGKFIMKFKKGFLLAFLLIVIFSTSWMILSSTSTVLLGIKGTMVDGNLIKFSGVAGVGEDTGVAALNVTKNKFDATIAPTVNNDTDEGYTIGSKWYDVTADKGYVCLDNTDGAAVWTEITGGGSMSFTGLTDTPANYTGEAGKYAKVNVGEDALEFDTPAGYINLTSFVDQTAWRLFYSNTDGDVIELALGTDGQVLTSGGVAVAPTFEDAGGAGETNTASNIGSETEIFKQKTGVDLELRTLKADSAKIVISTIPKGGEIIVGEPAEDKSANQGTVNTVICKGNPANDTGIITSIEIWAVTTMSGVKIATFEELAANVFTAKSSVTLANITSGSKQTITTDSVGNPLALDITAGDFIGIWWTGGHIELGNSSGEAGFWDVAGDQTSCADKTFNFHSGYGVSLYGTGVTQILDYVRFDVVPSEIAKEIGGLLSTTTVAFNANADTTLYTVPAGKRCVLSHAMVVAAADAGATTTISIGANGAETDFIPANTLSNLDAQYDSVILQPIPNTTPLKIKSYAAATIIEAQVASQSGAAGNTIYLFGITY